MTATRLDNAGINTPPQSSAPSTSDSTATNQRNLHWDNADQAVFDVAVIGGGINGASLYHDLCRQGWRTLLIDHQDFAAGSSQASGMMVWGGLLYLQVGDVLTVARPPRARDRMIDELQDWIDAALFRYIPSRKGGMPSPLIGAGLGFYWLLAGGRRRLPTFPNGDRAILDQYLAACGKVLAHSETTLAGAAPVND